MRLQKGLSKLITVSTCFLQFTIGLMYDDYTVYDYITSHISNTGGNHIIESDKKKIITVYRIC